MHARNKPLLLAPLQPQQTGDSTTSSRDSTNCTTTAATDTSLPAEQQQIQHFQQQRQHCTSYHCSNRYITTS